MALRWFLHSLGYQPDDMTARTGQVNKVEE
ncbi:hypothetical protein Godav_004689 [Gossypium davidsonii]|uniref:Uncharacterized protein n=1 Tax=Gossypium davidsonii TaxID=34287 RepID=A0A7J8SM35_GOSDV|nr:hypothetical protein [Gossypium davidsonii]